MSISSAKGFLRGFIEESEVAGIAYSTGKSAELEPPIEVDAWNERVESFRLVTIVGGRAACLLAENIASPYIE